MDTSDVSRKAFLVRPTISVWSARKLDKNQTEKTRSDAGATDKAGVRVYKTLVASDALDKVKEIYAKARTEHRKRTVPWHYDGPGAITAAGFADYMETMDAIKREAREALEVFLAQYSEAHRAAVSDLGSMFDENDYPPADVIRGKFGIDIAVEPMPQSSDFRVVGLSDAQSNAIKKDMQERFDNALKLAQGETWDRITKHVQHMMERLRAYKTAAESESGKVENRFHDTLVSNISELIDVLPSLNITNDPELTAIAVRLKRDLCGETAATLRDNADVRNSVADAAEAALREIWIKRKAARGDQQAA